MTILRTSEIFMRTLRYCMCQIWEP